MQTLCQVKQASCKRTNIVSFHLHVVPRVVKFIETENRMVVAKVWGEREIGSYNTYRVSVFQDKKNSGWMVMMVAQQYECS